MSKIKWRTEDGRILQIEEMSDKHLANAFKMIHRNDKMRAAESLLKEIKSRDIVDWVCFMGDAHRMFYAIGKGCPCVYLK